MLTYFLQVSLCWLVFYGLYYSLLSRETFFRLNRIYLIISLLCGLVAPFGQVFIEVKTTSPTVIMLEPFVVTAKAFQHKLTDNTEGVMSLQFFIQLVYWLGVSVMTGRFLIGLFQIFSIYKKGKKEAGEGFTTIYTEGVHLPFSFSRYIFINPNVLEQTDIQQIIQHEKAHVTQRHSLDVVFVEILNILFWWNPIIYFYRHSLRNIHEYLADAAVLQWVERPVYGRLLIKQSQSGPALALANHFIFSQLKKRIIMMTRNKSKRPALLKYALAAPIFLVLTIALASPKTPILGKAESLSDKIVSNTSNLSQKMTPQNYEKQDTVPTAINPENIESVNIEKDGDAAKSITIKMKDGSIKKYEGEDVEKFMQTQRKLEAEKKATNEQANKVEAEKNAALSELVVVGRSTQKNSPVTGQLNKAEAEKSAMTEHANKIEAEKNANDPVLNDVDELPEFAQGQKALFQWLGQNIKYPKISRENNFQGTVFVGFVVEKDGAITDVKVKRGAKGIIRDTVTIMEVNGIKGNKIVEREDFSLDNEAKRVIAAMPKWKPGKNKGQPVRVAYTLPIKFKLE